MFDEYEMVIAVKDLNFNVLKGCVGTIVMIYDGTPPQYEVEFFDDNRETLDVLTVNHSDLSHLNF